MPLQPPDHFELDKIALFLDFDGTLVHFNRPDETVPFVDEDLRTLVADLHAATDGALAIISGRALNDLENFFLPLRLRASGEHGSAWRIAPDMPSESIERPRGLLEMQAFCRALLADHPQVLLEEKPYSLVLHFHAHPALRDELAPKVAKACENAQGVKLLHARGMLEIKSKEVNKGAAVSRFMQHTPFTGRTPVFVGDDVSDEDAFSVVNAHHGISIKVGAGPSHAHYRLQDEDAVRAWLETLLDRGEERSTSG